MRAAAILGLGSSAQDLEPFRSDRVELLLGQPASREGLDAVLVFGGDGTVHRNLGALVKLRLPVLLIPAGSGNDFARALGLFRERDSLEAWASFVSEQRNVRTVDLGVIAQLNSISRDQGQGLASPGVPSTASVQPRHLEKITYFSCAAGIGLDGEIARRANALPRWLRAHGGYALSLPGAVWSFQPFVLRLQVAEHSAEDGFSLRPPQPMMAAVFANTPFYGGGMRVAPKAQMDDGWLDICLIHKIGKLKLLSVFPSVYFGHHLGIREVEYFSAASARLETEHPLAVYADGEYVCQTPVQIGVAKAALQVIAPG